MNQKIKQELLDYINKTFEQDVSESTEFSNFVNHLNDKILATYFGWDQTQGKQGGYWTQQISFPTRRTGQQLVNKILLRTDNPKILDVGCGDNEFKKFFNDNLTGIDPYNENADIKVSLEDYIAPEEYDIVFAFGSINFGDRKTIKKQIMHTVDFCKPGGDIYFRFNPGITHDHPKAQWIDFYPWSVEEIMNLGEELNCKVNEVAWDHTIPEEQIRWGNRLYSHWTKCEV